MAGSSDDAGRRRCPADLRDHAEPPEEGELVPGCDDDDSDVNTDDYYNNHHYYSSSDTDETTSDCNYARSAVLSASYGAAGGPSSTAAAAAANNNNGNAASSSSPVAAPAPAAVLACPICGKEFRSRKAVCGHMKVHQQGKIGRRHEQQQGIGKKNTGIKRNAAVTGGWGGTGRRGCTGRSSKPASPYAGAQSDQSMAIVVANPSIVLEPMPLAFAAPNPLPVRMESATPNQSSSVAMASATPNPSSAPIASTVTNASDESSSAKPMRSDDAMETVVAGTANPPTEAVVHLVDAARAPPSPPPAEVHATSIHQQPIQPPPPPPDAEEERVHLPPVHHQHPIAPLPLTVAVAVAGRQNPNGYTCRQCGVWFPTHQGLGGHIAGHKTRELAAAPCHRDAKPEKVHECRICGAVFTAGVQLGGHMRKHYIGAPIVPKKKPRLAIELPLPPPAPEQGALEPAPRPVVAGRLRLFGVDIEAAGAQTPAAQEEGSSATHQAPSPSTGGEEQQ